MKNPFAFVQLKPMLCVSMCLMLSACIPTVQRFYEAPMVTGRVLDLATLEPLAGVQASHWADTQTVVTSDGKGRFLLPSLSHVQAMLLMPGFVLRDYPVKLATSSSATLVMANAPGMMRQEQTVPVGDIVIDTAPGVIAPAPKVAHNEQAQLMALLDVNARLAVCDKVIGIMAVNTLNTARKLHLRLQASPTSAQLQALTAGSYQHVHELWQFWAASCDWSTLTKFDNTSFLERYDAIIHVRELIVELDAESPEG